MDAPGAHFGHLHRDGTADVLTGEKAGEIVSSPPSASGHAALADADDDQVNHLYFLACRERPRRVSGRNAPAR